MLFQISVRGLAFFGLAAFGNNFREPRALPGRSFFRRAPQAAFAQQIVIIRAALNLFLLVHLPFIGNLIYYRIQLEYHFLALCRRLALIRIITEQRRKFLAVIVLETIFEHALQVIVVQLIHQFTDSPIFVRIQNV